MRLAPSACVRAPTLTALLVFSACYVGPDDEPLPAIAGERRDQVAEDPSIPLEAAGWVDHEDSLIVPWCGAVLVAPDVAVTATRCVDGWSKGYLHVGFGGVSGPSHAVAEVVIEGDAIPEMEPRIHGLAALRLEEPVFGVVPVDLDAGVVEACDVETVAYEYMLRGDEGDRWTWAGCLRDGALMATRGAPNCHGDMGAGAFLENGALAGVAVDAKTEHWSTDGCMLGHRLATVAEHERFFELALDLSRVTTEG
jgi:hypothetical protein